MKSPAWIALIALFAACSPEGPGKPAGPGAAAAQAPQVSVLTLEPRSVALSTVLPGRTSAFRIAEIRPQVNGLVLRRLFEEGSMVKAGDVLYRIDPAPFQAALDNARAALGRAEANLPAVRAREERVRALLEEGAVSRQDHDDASAALKQATAEIAYWQAQVETARIHLGYTQITAPIAGRIGMSSITDGAIVTAYQPLALATIQQIDPIYVDVPQSTAELLRLNRRLAAGRLKPDPEARHAVRLFLEDGTPYPHEGTLQFRDITVDPATGAVTLRMVFPNPQGVLLPGMFVRAEIREGVLEQAILAPQAAILRNPKGEPYALVAGPGDKVEIRPLVLEREIGSDWLVASGLAAGDRLIVEG
ncbi:MAG: efflux RND transporter periplasmic adaptor subunit, partial [Desulfobacterales bacterium]